MADLRIENPKLTEQFAAACAQAGVPLPWSTNGLELLASDGSLAAEVGPDWLLPPGTLSVADLILLAVNTCGGFKAFVSSN